MACAWAVMTGGVMVIWAELWADFLEGVAGVYNILWGD